MLARPVRSPLHDVRQHAALDASSATNKCSHGRETGFQESGILRSNTSKAKPSTLAGRKPGWWSQTGSNRRPHACKARALPAELWPLSQNSHPARLLAKADCQPKLAERTKVVGLGRFELPTSRLSSARSNQLSYKPGSDDRPELYRASVKIAFASKCDAAIPQNAKSRHGLVHEERET
jgi:hypothetical protein